jgi:hypothetical protein
VSSEKSEGKPMMFMVETPVGAAELLTCPLGTRLRGDVDARERFPVPPGGDQEKIAHRHGTDMERLLQIPDREINGK